MLLVACGPSAGGDDLGDADLDGILDAHEGDADPDGDGIPARLDIDSDNDGLSDRDEAGDDDPRTFPVDTDRDGTPDFLDQDSDGNCLPDADERVGDASVDSDGDGLLDPLDVDDDGDGVLDTDEVAHCRDMDSDGDHRVDRLDLDSDDDDIPDAVEGIRDSDGDGVPDRLDDDSDNDGLPDREEAGQPAPRDSDADGRPDYRDIDSDNDGLRDDAETGSLDPLVADSDGDGVRDGTELQLGSNPGDIHSVPATKIVYATPRWEREAQVRVPVGVRRVDLVFVVDEHTGMRHFGMEPLRRVNHALMAEVDGDFAVGLAFATNYNADIINWGQEGRPTGLYVQPITTDEALIDGALALWTPDYGVGNAALEVLYQAITGDGYDIDCDGAAFHEGDVRPWTPRSDDAFGGTVTGRWSRELYPDGRGGGMGLRSFTQPIYAFLPTSWWFDFGESPYRSGSGWPTELGTCPEDGSTERVVRALNEQNALFVGVDTADGYNGQLRDLVERAGAYGDLDGDGASDDLLLLTTPSREVTPGYEQHIVDGLLHVIDAALEKRSPEFLSLAIQDDPNGFVVDFRPKTIPASDGAPEVEFSLLVRGTVPAKPTDQIHHVTLHAAGDGEYSMGHTELLVVVPGRGLQ